MMALEQKKHPQKMNFEGVFMSTIYVQEVELSLSVCNLLILFGVPKGIRSPVAGVKGSQHQMA